MLVDKYNMIKLYVKHTDEISACTYVYVCVSRYTVEDREHANQHNSGYLLGGEKELELLEETKGFLAISEIF